MQMYQVSGSLEGLIHCSSTALHQYNPFGKAITVFLQMHLNNLIQKTAQL